MGVIWILALFLSPPSGSWEPLGPDQGVVEFAYIPQEPFELYLCTENGHILYSSDAGETLELFASYDYEALAMDPFGDQEIVAHTPT